MDSPSDSSSQQLYTPAFILVLVSQSIFVMGNTLMTHHSRWVKALGGTEHDVGYVMGFGALIGLIVRPWMAQWINRIGARTMWGIGYLVFAAGSLSNLLVHELTFPVYAIRSEEFSPIPHDTILDDIIIPMQATRNGGRILFNKAARAFDPQPFNSDRERLRKQRTLGGNFQLLFRYHQWLTPWGHPLWWQLISHKHLRIFSPILLLACAISNITLLGSHSIYLVTGNLQFAVYATGLLGLCPKLSKLRPFSYTVAFLFLNAMVVSGFYYYLKYSRKPGWS